MINKYGHESSWFKSRSAGGSRRLSVTLAALGMAGALAVATAGCDTAAEINFQQRTFQKVYSSGFTAMPGTCGGVSGGDMRARFVLADNNKAPIMLGEEVNLNSNTRVVVELDAESVEFTNGALMEVTANACGSDGSSTCSSSPVAFQCGNAPNLSDAPKTCLIPEDGLSVASSANAVGFVSDTQNDQVYGILMENSGGLKGWSLPGTEEAWDANGNGVLGDTGPDGDLPAFGVLYGDPIASDPSKKRVSAVEGAYAKWVQAYKLARLTERKTYFGLWSFNDTEQRATSHIEKVGRPGNPWTAEPTPSRAAIDDYERQAINSRTRANVYEAALNLIEDSYSDQAMSDLGLQSPTTVDKVLTIFVDGYDDMRENDGSNVDIDSVITAATENNVRIFIVHADPAFQEPRQIREDPKYWQGQSPCVDDSTCKNYETCRKPKGYADPNNPSVILEPSGFDDTYCLPQRDENGRVGPIEEYSRLACATEGGYMYSPSINSVTRDMEWTPYALDGLWEVSVSSATMSRKSGLAGMPLKIHTEMRVKIAPGGDAGTYTFSQTGEGDDVASNATNNTYGSRGVVFTAE